MEAVKTAIALRPVIVRPENGNGNKCSNYVTFFIK
jgi:hypothetical protein